jgi:NADPH:quinone reductase-like Zn-dependent oxidoreductase
MKAVVCRRYGPPEVLTLEEVEQPVPGPDQVLIRVRATTVTRTDCELRAAIPFFSRLVTGLLRPRWPVLGYEVAGEVVGAGSAVTRFAVGDEVFGANGGLRADSFGAHAEFLCMRETAPLARKPDAMTFEQAAAVCDGALLALGCLRPANIQAGTKVLVYGASGSIGTAAVQLARHFGAHVTAVCGPANLELAQSLGADQVIDYTRDDFARNGQVYDIIYDAVGKLRYRRCRGSLAREGRYLATDHLTNIARAAWTARSGGRRVIFPIPPQYRQQDVEFLRQLIEAGQYRAVIDRSYRLEEAAEAMCYVQTGQKTGNVVLTVGS